MKFWALWLSVIIVFVFILQLAIPGFTEAFVLNEQSYYQPWRFITAIFLHASPTHILYNLFALIFFGLVLEKLIETKKFLLVFFITGIIANLFAVNFYPASLGASGAIFGVIGALTIIKPTMGVFAFGFPMPLFIASALWIIGDVIGTFIPSNVGTIAHLSGVGIGIIMGLCFRLKKKKQIRYEIKIPETYVRAWEDTYMR